MVVEIAIYKIVPGNEARALAELEDRAAFKRGREGCRDARVLAASRSVSSPSTDPQLILAYAEFEDVPSFAAYREAVTAAEGDRGPAPLTGLAVGPPTYGVFE
jgi:hypothetical protein